eukprot:3942708-Alexandrium_andersonii.AAC.1
MLVTAVAQDSMPWSPWQLVLRCWGRCGSNLNATQQPRNCPATQHLGGVGAASRNLQRRRPPLLSNAAKMTATATDRR